MQVAADVTTPGALRVVARHAVPTIVEATLVPTALFYVGWILAGPLPAYAIALTWAYGMLARRMLRRQRVPGILVLTLVGLTLRTALAVWTGSSFLYFAQPIMGTTVGALLFLASALTDRPFVARMAHDFFPLSEDLARRGTIRALFRQLTFLWAGVNLVNACVGASLLLTMPASIYIPVKTVTALSITAIGVTLTVRRSLRVGRAEGLFAAPAG
jgi:intracellular septation protein A